MNCDAYISRDGWEIPIDYDVEEIYHGTNNTDDPSTCTICEKAVVAADVVDDFGKILWKEGEALFLTEDELRDLEQEEFNRYCEEQQESYYEWLNERDT